MFTEIYEGVLVNWQISKWIKRGYAVVNIWQVDIKVTIVTYQKADNTKDGKDI